MRVKRITQPAVPANDSPEPGFYGPGEEFGPALPEASAAEEPTQELVETEHQVPVIPPEPLHLRVANLAEREAARETHLRLCHEENDRLRERMETDRAGFTAIVERQQRQYEALLARVQELGDWVGAPEWKPGEGA